jgi:hypothetical protein
LTLAPGAGHGGEGDASFQGPAQETDQAQIDTLPAQPKSTNTEKPTHSEQPSYAGVESGQPGAVIALAARAAKLEDVGREAGLVMTRPKPEKRKNAKERAKERARDKGKPEAAEVTAAAPEASGLATAHPKPEKRRNAKERAMERAKQKYASKDGTTPDTTAKAKSRLATKAESKARKSKTDKAA